MSGIPTSQVPEPESPLAGSPLAESPPPGPPGDTPPLPAAHKRSRRKRILTPLVLAVLGLLLFLLVIIFYPSTATDVRTPPYSRLALETKFPVALIGLSVIQVSSSIAEMKISVELPVGTTAPPAGLSAGLVVAPALGTAFRHCHAPSCVTFPGSLPASEWGVTLTFRSARGSAGVATADFFVKARSFGVAYNSITASAAIPEFIYRGPGTPMFLVGYNIPSAASYDWSSFPTAAVSNHTASWQEDLTSVDSPGRAAVGINPAGQASHDNKTFIVGALVGLAGAAILSAIQEALHASD
jgi:hypothetical protein